MSWAMLGQRLVVNVSNDSLTVLVLVGRDFPFPDARLELSVHDEARNGSIVHAASFGPLVPGRNHSDVVESGIRADTWYRVRACLRFSLPNDFRAAHPALLLQHTQLRCLEDESARTLSWRSSAANSPFPKLLPLLLLPFLLPVLPRR